MNSQDAKWYANAIHCGTIEMREIAKEMAEHSRFNYGDILNILIDFLDKLPPLLKDGRSVKLDDFGIFRLSLSSEGSLTEKEFKTENIKSKVVFTAGKNIKDELETIHYKHI